MTTTTGNEMATVVVVNLLRTARERLAAVQRHVPVIQLVAIVAFIAYGAQQIPGFASRINLTTIAVLASLLALSALGQTIVVMLGGIDLSVGYMIGFGAVAIPYYAADLHAPFSIVAAAGLLVAALVGTFSGVVSYFYGVHPLMLTLAAGTCIQGWTLLVNRGASSPPLPAWLGNMSLPTSTTLGLGMPPTVALLIVVTAISVVVLARTAVGRRLYATGANPRAAGLALVRPARIWIGGFALSALAATAVGLLLGGFSGTSDSTVGNSYVFEGIAAVVVGGTAFGGGQGSYLRTVIGALFLTTLSTMLVSLNYSPADTQIVSGLLIFAVILINARERSVRSRI